tara:strand:+ start:2406 stop:5132 length:2727 start_codon:yes stop_codon:yes gene_type:complete
MSVQLILYPQNQTTTTNQFLVDGINFAGLNFTTNYGTAALQPANDAVSVGGNPALILNTWYRYRTTGGVWASVTTPTEASGVLVFSFTAAPSRSGIYQRLSSLTMGQSYTVTVNISAAVVGILRIRTYSGPMFLTTFSASTNTLQISTTFVASTPNDTVLIDYQSASGNLNIDNISVSQTVVTPADEYEGQVICDLYEDEDIPITLSIDDFKNVAEKVQSYSKSFNLPATKRNNQIFTNLFEVTMVQDVYSFNPYIKTPCLLKQDGFILFQGYLKLIDIQDKEAEISYNVNLYSEVIALADVLENRTFQDIDLTELSHRYNKIQIKATWTGAPTYSYANTSGFRGTDTLKYPFVDWEHQFLVGGSGTGTNATVGFPEMTSLEQAFRPFINIKYLINRIFANTDFTWTSSLFDNADFAKLYMDFNWGADGLPTPENTYIGKWGMFGIQTPNIGNNAWKELRLVPLEFEPAMANVGSEVPPNYQGDSTQPNPYIITATTDNEVYNISHNFRVENTSALLISPDFRWLHTSAINGVQPAINPMSVLLNVNGNGAYVGNFQVILNTGDTLKAQFNTTTNVRQREGALSTCTFVVSSLTVGSAGLLTLRGETNQWDFLKGIMTMFNIISIPDQDNPNNINFETYNDIFITNAKSSQFDWTTKVDVSEMKLTPLGDLNKKTIFKFADDDDDYTFNVYKNSVGGHLYGSKVYDASGLTLLEGEDEIVAEPFAATVIKPLFPQYPDFITPAVFSSNEDATVFEGFDNAPRIMYNNGVVDTGITYYIPSQGGGSSENQPEILQFSHLSTIPTAAGTLDFHFGECQLIQPVGASVPDNLFNLYWLPYYSELYNPNTRVMTLKVNLSPSDINTFKFYDIIFIKNRTFRVNKIDYKPNELAVVEFILVANLGNSGPPILG